MVHKLFKLTKRRTIDVRNPKEIEEQAFNGNNNLIICCGIGALALVLFGMMAYNKGLAAGRSEVTDVIVGLARSGAMR